MDIVIAAVIAAIAALGGAIVGSRLQARHERVQWRREKLLQLCTDLLSASTEMVQIGLKHEDDPTVRLPIALVNRLLYASAGIALISPELQSAAEACEEKAAAVFDASAGELTDEAHKAAEVALGHFVREARKVVLNLHPDLDPPKPKKERRKPAGRSLPWPFRGRNTEENRTAPALQRQAADSVTAAPTDTPGGTTPAP